MPPVGKAQIILANVRRNTGLPSNTFPKGQADGHGYFPLSARQKS
jgi:hypothetical protein